MERINPYRAIYNKIDNESVDSKIDNIGVTPKVIMIEPLNYCNFTCNMCPTGRGLLKRTRGAMSMEVFSRIVDQIKGKGVAIKLVGDGEPLLHPQILDFIKLAKSNGILCHITTNGSLLTTDIMRALIDLKLDSLKFSFQGVDTVGYEEMRNNGRFEELMRTITTLNEVRGEQEKPYITVTTSVTYETPDQVQSFIDRAGKIADRVEIGKTMLDKMDIDRVKLPESREKLRASLQEDLRTRKRFKCCTEVFDSLSIAFDGTVSPCCRDSEYEMNLGNIMDHTIEELWLCNKVKKYREILAECRFEEINLCKDCYDYMGYTLKQQ